jgi:hypothetical protein
VTAESVAEQETVAAPGANAEPIPAVRDGLATAHAAEQAAGAPGPVASDDDTVHIPVIRVDSPEDAPAEEDDTGSPRTLTPGSQPPHAREDRYVSGPWLALNKVGSQPAAVLPAGDVPNAPEAWDSRPLGVPATHDGDTQYVSAREIHKYAAEYAIERLCEQFAAICESAVDPLEIASALEFEGVSDGSVEALYDCPDVFALAEKMYRRVPRRPAEPAPPSDPWQHIGRLRPALRGMLYALPGVCFPAGIGLFVGPAVPLTLIVALLVSWSLSQGIAYLGYRRLGSPDAAHTHQVLLVGLSGGIAVLVAALGLVAHVAQPDLSVLAFGLGEGLYMLCAAVMMVFGAEQLLLLALAPGVLGSAAFLTFGRPAHYQHDAWAAMAATPLLAVVLVVGYAVRAWRASAGRRTGPLLLLADLRGALAATAFGLTAGGLMIFPVAAGPDGHGGINTAALLASLPLTLSMGAGEWTLLWYRRRMQRMLTANADLRVFGSRARLTLFGALLQYLAGVAVLITLAAVVAYETGLLRIHRAALPELGAYLALGGAMFVALLLQAFGDRILPLTVCAAALAAEIAYRSTGWIDQVSTCAGLFVMLVGYAVWAQGSVIRYA